MMYNLEWMLTMQDPTDGGVYHKLTTPNFEGFASSLGKRSKNLLRKNVMRKSKNWLPLHSTVSSATAPKTSTGEATLKAAWEEALPKCTSMP